MGIAAAIYRSASGNSDGVLAVFRADGRSYGRVLDGRLPQGLSPAEKAALARVRAMVLQRSPERLNVRLGPDHEITRKLLGADEAVLDIFRALGVMRLEEPAEEPDVRREVRRFT